MKVLEFLIDKEGELIYPTTIAKANTEAMSSAPIANQITCTFYDDIETNSDGSIVPIDPVISGMTGTLTIQARPTDDSAWSDIQDGVLDLSSGDNMIFPAGLVRSLNAACNSITGCEYILIRMDRGI